MNTDVVCPINIGRKEQRKRLVLGVIVIALTLAATPYFLSGALPRLASLGLALPFWFGSLAVLQALQKT